MNYAFGEPSPYEAVPLDFTFTAATDAVWESEQFERFLLRDLKLDEASHGQMKAIELKAEHEGRLDAWPNIASSAFLMFYVMAGQVTFEMQNDEMVTLCHRDVAHLPFLLGTGKVEYTADFHAVLIAAPLASREHEPVPLLHIQPVVHEGPWESVIVRNRPELYIRGDGPRSYFTYRDLGSAGITDRRIHVHDGDGVKTQLTKGTGWHNHSMSQFFFVLGGAATILVENEGEFRVVPGDAMTLGRGMKHDVVDIAIGYNVIEVCLPADYSTVAQDAPEV